MNLVMSYNNINVDSLLKKERVTNFDILSQILPPFSTKMKNSLYNHEEKNKDIKINRQT